MSIKYLRYFIVSREEWSKKMIGDILDSLSAIFLICAAVAYVAGVIWLLIKIVTMINDNCRRNP